ncbi:thiamine pyrophosphate-dependent enzyme [Agrococcus sp. Ld7]|uniref:thiamine pyrophosphate-dependent enzyme n=1 Tax=Agrococcus sp. Ld7 TaxID=649148 RepID=UPI0038652C70
MTMRAGHLLIESLHEQGLTHYTCVPGESFLPALDAMPDYPGSDLTVCRHESPAGHMAEAHGKLTGMPGVCFVTRGPGAMHASIAVHTADQDATPLLLFIGQIDAKDRGRGAFQEFDSHQVFSSMAKWVVTIDRAERIPETIARAVRIATTGRPGPVVIELPENMLYDEIEAQQARPVAQVERERIDGLAEQLADELAAAQRPLVVLGRGGWGSEQHAAIARFAERNALPVVAAWRSQDLMDNDSCSYVGHLSLSVEPELVSLVEESDLIIGIGGHFGDVDTRGYQLLQPAEGRRVVHIARAEVDLDRYVHADIAVVASSGEALRSIDGLVVDSERWQGRTAAAHEDYLLRRTPAAGDLLGNAIAWLTDRAPAGSVIANGAGNYAVWLHRYYRYSTYGTQLAPANGAMSYGLPAGIAAATLDPEKPTFVFGGDGCFAMSSMELATVAARQLPVISIVVNNEAYGTIRMHQEREFPGRVSGTSLVNPDFAALARAHGIAGHTVTDLEGFMSAIETALASGGPSLIEMQTDVRRISPTTRIIEGGLAADDSR